MRKEWTWQWIKRSTPRNFDISPWMGSFNSHLSISGHCIVYWSVCMWLSVVVTAVFSNTITNNSLPTVCCPISRCRFCFPSSWIQAGHLICFDQNMVGAMSAVSHLAASALLSCCPELTHRDPDYPAGDPCGEKMPASPQLFQPLQLSC